MLSSRDMSKGKSFDKDKDNISQKRSQHAATHRDQRNVLSEGSFEKTGGVDLIDAAKKRHNDVQERLGATSISSRKSIKIDKVTNKTQGAAEKTAKLNMYTASVASASVTQRISSTNVGERQGLVKSKASEKLSSANLNQSSAQPDGPSLGQSGLDMLMKKIQGKRKINMVSGQTKDVMKINFELRHHKNKGFKTATGSVDSSAERDHEQFKTQRLLQKHHDNHDSAKDDDSKQLSQFQSQDKTVNASKNVESLRSSA